MTAHEHSPPRTFDRWELALIGDAEILLSHAQGRATRGQGQQGSEPPVLHAVIRPGTMDRSPLPSGKVLADNGGGRSSLSMRPAHSGVAVPQRPVQEEHLATPGHGARRGGRWRRAFAWSVAAVGCAIVGLVWLGKQGSLEQRLAESSQDEPPSFGAPIKLPPKVAPLDDHRPEQLDQATSATVPADLLAKAMPVEAGAPIQPSIPLVPVDARVANTATADHGNVSRPPTSSTAGRLKSRARVQRGSTATGGPDAAASGPASLIAIGETGGQLASAVTKPESRAEAASEPAPAASSVTASPPAQVSSIAGPVDTSGVRRAVYGRSGIVALTANSVVLYDRERRVQTEVRAGGALPDGSRLVSVQPGRHRVETDRGVLELSAPTSSSSAP